MINMHKVLDYDGQSGGWVVPFDAPIQENFVIWSKFILFLKHTSLIDSKKNVRLL